MNFDHTNRWYMHDPESMLENEMHKVFWDFAIKTNHQISARRSDPMNVDKKKRELTEERTLLPIRPQSEFKR